MLDYAPGLLTKKKLFLSCLYQLFWHSSQKLTDKGALRKEGSTGENKIQFSWVFWLNAIQYISEISIFH